MLLAYRRLCALRTAARVRARFERPAGTIKHDHDLEIGVEQLLELSDKDTVMIDCATLKANVGGVGHHSLVQPASRVDADACAAWLRADRVLRAPRGRTAATERRLRAASADALSLFGGADMTKLDFSVEAPL